MAHKKKYFSPATLLIALIYYMPLSTMQDEPTNAHPDYMHDSTTQPISTLPSLQQLCLRSFPNNVLTDTFFQDPNVAPQNIKEMLKKEHIFRQFISQYRTIDEALEKILQNNKKVVALHTDLSFFEIIQQFIYLGANLNIHEPKDQYTPLIMAAYHNDYDSTQLLLNSGATLDEVDGTGSTALNIATAHASYPLIELLIEKKADPNALDFRGFSPLDWAVLNQREHVVPLLLAHSADPNRSHNIAELNHRNHHPSPLQYAVHHGNTSIMKMLIEAGAHNLDVALEDAHNYEQEDAALLLQKYLREKR